MPQIKLIKRRKNVSGNEIYTFDIVRFRVDK